MRPRDHDVAERIERGLYTFNRGIRRLPGIDDPAVRATLLEQLLESIHRVKYVTTMRGRKLSSRRADPNDSLFDPLKAAIIQERRGNTEEAFWLIFLFVHFGKNARGGWRYAREVYGRLGDPGRWDWAATSADPWRFREWLDINQGKLKRRELLGGFGNHRKYQSLEAYSASGTGAAVESYVNWVSPPRTHRDLMEEACMLADGDPRAAFDHLYRSMDAVISFGRTARFDYLAMIGKLDLAQIEPGSAYIRNSTGPLAGARLLFTGKRTSKLNASMLEPWLTDLGSHLDVGMQVIEDALCNWQKSPREFKPFRG
jgi:hypothetical protein